MGPGSAFSRSLVTRRPDDHQAMVGHGARATRCVLRIERVVPPNPRGFSAMNLQAGCVWQTHGHHDDHAVTNLQP
jgi:hypothetical protein